MFISSSEASQWILIIKPFKFPVLKQEENNENQQVGSVATRLGTCQNYASDKLHYLVLLSLTPITNGF